MCIPLNECVFQLSVFVEKCFRDEEWIQQEIHFYNRSLSNLYWYTYFLLLTRNSVRLCIAYFNCYLIIMLLLSWLENQCTYYMLLLRFSSLPSFYVS